MYESIYVEIMIMPRVKKRGQFCFEKSKETEKKIFDALHKVKFLVYYFLLYSLMTCIMLLMCFLYIICRQFYIPPSQF